jgi:predicted transposase YbfD/YdcC
VKSKEEGGIISLKKNLRGEKMEKTIVEILSEIPDYRKGNAIRHNLTDILMIGILTFLCNGNGYAAMTLFGETHEEALREYMALSNGIPSQDTFERVFAKLNPRALEAQFKTWTDDIIDTIKDYINVSIDGKTACGSKSEDKKALHVVTAFASDLQLVLGQLATDEKSNEITAITKLLEMFCKKGMIITIDAMGTQTNIAQTIIGLGGEYVLALKGNQPSLLNDVTLFMETEVMTQNKDTLRENGQYQRTIEKGHGRIETRECFVSHDIGWLDSATNWAGLSGFGVIVSKRDMPGKEPETNSRFYIFSNEQTTASDLLRIVRSHWAIENNLHWSLDVIFDEDDSRARLENAQENLNILRKHVLHLLKSDSSTKGSIQSKRLRCAWDLFYALTVIGVQ